MKLKDKSEGDWRKMNKKRVEMRSEGGNLRRRDLDGYIFIRSNT